MKKLIVQYSVTLFIAMFLLPCGALQSQIAEYPQNVSAIPNTTLLGVLPGVLVYSGDVDEALNNFNIELFARLPFPNSDNLSLYAGIGYSNLEGHDYDANMPPRTFITRNPFAYGVVMPGLKINDDDKIAVWLKAGLGVGFLKAVNSETEGTKLLVPLGIDFNYHFNPRWVFIANARYMFATTDLDGLRRGGDPDYREPDNLIGISMGLGFIP